MHACMHTYIGKPGVVVVNKVSDVKLKSLVIWSCLYLWCMLSPFSSPVLVICVCSSGVGFNLSLQICFLCILSNVV
jgi:hypothetical protein